MAQKGVTISNLGGRKGANVGTITRFVKCVIIYSNTTK